MDSILIGSSIFLQECLVQRMVCCSSQRGNETLKTLHRTHVLWNLQGEKSNLNGMLNKNKTKTKKPGQFYHKPYETIINQNDMFEKHALRRALVCLCWSPTV